MRHFFKYYILFFILLFSCQGGETPPDTSFYHWKSYYDLSKDEMDYLDSLDVMKLYVRYFDVGIQNGKAQPLGKIINKNDFIYPNEIIPTIFITNETFLKTPLEDIDGLVLKIEQLIHTKHQLLSEKNINEVQFDCDWSQKTRELYFLFLNKIKNKTNWNISVTIRLHQVKYKEKTGVPPADSFVLMCYNTGELKDLNEKNSILEPEVVESYVSGMSEYPHSLKVALPLFSWGVLFRDNQLIKLIRNINTNTFSENEKFKVEDNWVETLESTYLNGYYLYEGDKIRLESVKEETLISTANILRKHLDPREIIYYHLDDIIINQYTHESLENINLKFIGQ